MTDDHQAKLTPAGLQVERALALGLDAKAYNLYYDNLQDDVPMIDDDQPLAGEWHRKIQSQIGEGPTRGEDVAAEEAVKLGLDGEERSAYIAERVDELNDHQPSIVERRVRNDAGEIIDRDLESGV